MPLPFLSKEDQSIQRSTVALLAAKVIALFVMVVTFGIATGWLVDSRELKTAFYYQKVVPGNLAVFWFLTALSFFSLALNTKYRWLRTCGAILAALLVSVMLYATVVGYFFHHLPYTSFAIQFLQDASAIEIPGNIVWVEALPVFAMNLFLLLVYFRRYSKSNLVLIVIALWPMCQALVGYAFDLPDLFTFCTNEECARLHPILALFAVAMGLAIASRFLGEESASDEKPIQSIET